MLISGRGRNLQALTQATRDGRIRGEIVAVISNRADAAGLDYAERAGLPCRVLPHQAFATRAAFDTALLAELEACAPDSVALAGFMRVLGEDAVRRFSGRMLNIHPSLLPRHPGLHTHARVLAQGDAMHGATVHFVSDRLDGGPSIVQGGFMVSTQDTLESLAERVMNEIEIRIYPQALAWMARGELHLRGTQVWFRGAPLTAPLGLEHLEDAFR